MDASTSVFLRPRRFGLVNWQGCASLLRRHFKSGFSDLHYTILGPVISNALYLLLFVIASSSLTNLDPTRLVGFIAPGTGISEVARFSRGLTCFRRRWQRGWKWSRLSP